MIRCNQSYVQLCGALLAEADEANTESIKCFKCSEQV
jgi:hypothetical protein